MNNQMPSKGVAIALIVVGFLAGIIWGIVGLVNYFPMSRAIEEGDIDTATRKWTIIRNVTIAGIAVNVVFVLARSFM